MSRGGGISANESAQDEARSCVSESELALNIIET